MIDKIEAACAEGDQACYEEIVQQEYPFAKKSTPGAQTSGDPQGNSGTGAPGPQDNPGPGSDAPIVIPRGGVVTGSESSQTGTGMQPTLGTDPCKSNPKAVGCRGGSSPPKQEK